MTMDAIFLLLVVLALIGLGLTVCFVGGVAVWLWHHRQCKPPRYENQNYD